MSENISPKRIQFPNEWGMQAVDDLKTDLEPFCNIPCSTGRRYTRDDTLKKTVEPEKSPEEETDENESSKSVNVSGNAKTEEPEKHEEKSTEEETDENESSKSVNVSGNAKTEEPEKHEEKSTEDEIHKDEIHENEIDEVNEKEKTVKPENSLEKYKSRESTQVKEEDEKLWKKVGSFALGTAVISGVVLGGTALLLSAIGFGALGPIAGSMAAAYQSTVLGGTIASGSAFATLQSVGMVGLSTAAKSGVVAGSAAASAAITKLRKKKK